MLSTSGAEALRDRMASNVSAAEVKGGPFSGERNDWRCGRVYGDVEKADTPTRCESNKDYLGKSPTVCGLRGYVFLCNFSLAFVFLIAGVVHGWWYRSAEFRVPASAIPSADPVPIADVRRSFVFTDIFVSSDPGGTELESGFLRRTAA
ncbi:hypothetical protein M407DRAFT_236165 [Tulasnella calospora MUT 4182]|uniref:Uncharacterized protein n=1 Tax=Tulasnella calospora MUT 4182 TaxID=1051891 RepID=A0A0C3K2U3_9AGAM|nr:hypothetical protein M407DRAFT_236165 [Tulasnella calospora MUT 4182]